MQANGANGADDSVLRGGKVDSARIDRPERKGLQGLFKVECGTCMRSALPQRSDRRVSVQPKERVIVQSLIDNFARRKRSSRTEHRIHYV